MDFFDDDFGWEEFAMALGLGAEMAEEEGRRRDLLTNDESFVSEDGDLEWYEKD